MPAKWRSFSKEQLEDFVKNSNSLASLANKIGYSNIYSGSTNNAMKQMIEYYNFDISHFTGQGWNKNNYDYSKFRKNTNHHSSNLAPALIHLRGYICEKCGLSQWNNQPIILEVHHLDGDKTNNELDNLQLLCPNCHSQTNNWRNRRISDSGETGETHKS